MASYKDRINLLQQNREKFFPNALTPQGMLGTPNAFSSFQTPIPRPDLQNVVTPFSVPTGPFAYTPENMMSAYSTKTAPKGSKTIKSTQGKPNRNRPALRGNYDPTMSGVIGIPGVPGTSVPAGRGREILTPNRVTHQNRLSMLSPEYSDDQFGPQLGIDY